MVRLVKHWLYICFLTFWRFNSYLTNDNQYILKTNIINYILNNQLCQDSWLVRLVKYWFSFSALFKFNQYLTNSSYQFIIGHVQKTSVRFRPKLNIYIQCYFFIYQACFILLSVISDLFLKIWVYIIVTVKLLF